LPTNYLEPIVADVVRQDALLLLRRLLQGGHLLTYVSSGDLLSP
jgi:hypothetical protein